MEIKMKDFLQNYWQAKKNALNYIAENLISASEFDDDLMTKYLEGEEISVDEIKEAFRGKSFEELTEILAALTDELKNTK